MKEAGVALQTFYRIFGGKDQLLLAVFEDLIAESCVDYERSGRRCPIRSRGCTSTSPRPRCRRSRARRCGIGPRFVTAEHWRLHQLFPEEMAHATQHFTDMVARQLELAAADGLWRVDRLAARRLVRHQAGDGGVPPLRVRRGRARSPTRSREQLWRSASAPSAAPSHRESQHQGEAACSELDGDDDPRDPRRAAHARSWLNPVLSSAVPRGARSRRSPRAGRRAGVDQRPVQDRGRPPRRPPARAVRQGVLQRGRARAARNAGVPEAASTATSPAPIGVRTLNSVWADVDPSTSHGVVITEDAAEAGAVFCSALDSCTVDRTAEPLEQFAKLHAYAWEQPEIVTAESRGSPPRLAWILHVRGLKEISANFDGPNGAGVPDGTRDAQGAHRRVRAPVVAGSGPRLDRRARRRARRQHVPRRRRATPVCSTGR